MSKAQFASLSLFFSISIFIFLCFYLYRKNEKISAFLFVLLGMSIGMFSGYLVFYELIKIRSMNPYGWWFLATFIFTVLGGLSGMFIYSNITNRKTSIDKK
jgi:DMSO reductase anchor subunit